MMTIRLSLNVLYHSYSNEPDWCWYRCLPAIIWTDLWSDLWWDGHTFGFTCNNMIRWAGTNPLRKETLFFSWKETNHLHYFQLWLFATMTISSYDYGLLWLFLSMTMTVLVLVFFSSCNSTVYDLDMPYKKLEETNAKSTDWFQKQSKGNFF